MKFFTVIFAIIVCMTNYTSALFIADLYNTTNKTGHLLQAVNTADKFVRVFNRGGYVAQLKLTYEVLRGSNLETVVQTGSIVNGQGYGFKIPYLVSYDSPNGCVLEVNAVGGINVMRVRIRSNPECFDVWGTTLIPFYSGVNCPEKFVKVYNKGAYVAALKLTYEISNGGNTKERVVQTGSITTGQDYGFKIPYEVVYDGDVGCTLEVNAVGGINVMRVRIHSNPECFDVWGTTLIPYWSNMNCMDNFNLGNVIPNPDKIVNILNKGWYVASLRLTYEIQNGANIEKVVQTGSIASGQAYGFRIPFSVNYDTEVGCTLEINAVAGVNVLRVKIRSNPQCFHIWGSTLSPSWSYVNC